MNKFRFTIKVLIIAAFVLAFTSMAQAQATRTWVSGVGDDVNPCSRTAPCKTFAGAISKTAAGGEIDCLDPGGFGAVTITKSITLDGTHGSGFGSILASATNGVNVNDSATGTPGTIIVKLRSLSINGAGTTPGTNGVNFVSGGKVDIEDCKIFGFTNSGANLGNGINMNLTLGGKTLVVKDTDIFNNVRGVRITTTTGVAAAVLENVRINNNTGDGIVLLNGGFMTVRSSNLSFNNNGVVVTGSGAANSAGANIIDTALLGNTGTGLAANNNSSRVGSSTFIGNGTGISQAAANTVKTFGDNQIADTVTGGGLQLIPPQ
jgi:hypothetical protein